MKSDSAPFANVAACRTARSHRAPVVAGLAASFAGFALLLSFAACSGAPAPAATPGADAGDSCDKTIPLQCGAPAPHYDGDVAPVLAARCLTCHSDGGVAFPGVDLTTYASVYRQRVTAFSQISQCRMPPEGSPAPTAEERATLLEWFVCEAPQ